MPTTLTIITRQQWGARDWNDEQPGQPYPVTIAEKDEFFVHYHGGIPRNDRGVAMAKEIEAIHMGGKNLWSGVGYSFMVGQDGVAYEGRSWFMVNAACPDHNRRGVHVYVAVGLDQKPSAAALATVRALYAEHTRLRSVEKLAAPAKTYHGAHYATACPGPVLIPWVKAGMPADELEVPTPPKTTPPPKLAPPKPTPSKPSPKPAPRPTPPKEPAMAVSVVPGGRVHTGFKVPGNWAAGYHTGEDWHTGAGQADLGKRVNAPVVGRVVHAGRGGWGAAYGIHVIIEDYTGDRTAVCHLQSESVSVGQQVGAGDPVGRLGTTGNVSGPHVHVERRHAPYRYGDHEKPVYGTPGAGGAGGGGASTVAPSPSGSYPKPKTRVVYDSLVKPGQRNSDSVYWVQAALNAVSLKGGRDIPLSGNYDALTTAEVKKFQSQKCGDTGDGDLGPRQTRRLFQLAKINITHKEKP